MGRADEALYRSKDAGRNCGHWHDGQQLLPLIDKPIPVAHGVAMGGPNRLSGATVDVDQREGGGKESTIDAETQLLNQSAFAKNLARMLAESRRTGVTMSIVMFRIDHYNAIAQRYGAKSDGLVLRSIGRLLATTFSTAEPVARYNNDSFAVILPGVSLAAAVRIGERVRVAVSELAITIADTPLQFTISVGVGQERGNDGSAPLIDRVHSAVSLAAGRGGDQVVVSDGDGFERNNLGRSQGAALSGAFPVPQGVTPFGLAGPTVVR